MSTPKSKNEYEPKVVHTVIQTWREYVFPFTYQGQEMGMLTVRAENYTQARALFATVMRPEFAFTPLDRFHLMPDMTATPPTLELVEDTSEGPGSKPYTEYLERMGSAYTEQYLHTTRDLYEGGRPNDDD